MESARYVVSLALHRLRRREAGALAAALGIAAAAAVLAGILVGGTVAKDRSVAQAVERLPAASRSVRASWFGVPAGADESWPTLDRRARAALAPLPAGDPVPIALVRESTVGGVFVGLAAVDGLAPYVLLRSGRLPRACGPERCEVLRLRGTGRLPHVPGLRVVEVGTATLRSRQLFGDFLAPTDNALADAELAPALARSARYHLPAPAPLVVAEGVEGLASSPVLATSYRSYSWVQPLSPGTPRLWQIDGLVGDGDRARAELQASSSSWSVTVPSQELDAAEHDATVAGRRLLLVGGEAAALLVAFAVLAAGALRRDLASARRRLTWHGAQRWQRALLTGTESAAVGFGGAVAGWVVGSLGGALAAAAAGAPVGPVLGESVLSPTGLLLGVGVGVLAAVVIAATVSLEARRHGRLGALDVAAIAAVVAALAILASGSVDADELAAGGAAPVVLLLLPGLLAFAAAVAASRLLPLVGRLFARRGAEDVRLAGVSVARAPGAAGVAAAFLALAVGLAVLAEAYRSTLETGVRDQAAYAVPADVVVREDLRALVPVLRAATLARFSSIPGVEAAYPVFRSAASAGPASSISGVTVLGVPGGAVRAMPLWRHDWGMSERALAAAVAPVGSTRFQGVDVRGAALRVEAGPSLLSYRATIEQRDGSFRVVDLGSADARRSSLLSAPLPPRARGGRLVALTLVPPRIIERGSNAGVALQGRTTLRLLGGSLTGWIGENGVTLRGAGAPGALTLDYAVTPQREARVRARQPTDDSPPRVAVTSDLAQLSGGVGGTLRLRIGGEEVPVRVAAVVDRIPGTTEAAVLADLGALSTALDAASPGAADVSELWLEVAGGRQEAVVERLSRPPFAALATASREALERDARKDPLGHGTLLALAAAALAALVLAAAGLVLAIRADLRDDRGELTDLEAQGATPGLLRRVVAARAALVALVGAAAGVLVGVALAFLVTRVVSVTARADVPEPPLATTVDPLTVALAAVLFALAAAALVGLTTRRAFADPRGPGRVGGEP
ncbi:MAG TPA: FtsX-like permease family protein [Gaiella sp.]|nr:FtsX-like permease family protein [Gaiella sp.]